MTRHVLLVDDDPTLLHVLAIVLDLEDEFVVSTATDGAAALAAVAQAPPDVIVCDVTMPELDGLEVCRRVKAATTTARIPVILLTARGRDEDRQAGEAVGCDAYLTKPFTPAQLVDTVRSCIQRAVGPER